MTRIEIPFTTVRAQTATLAAAVQAVIGDNRIVFGPGHMGSCADEVVMILTDPVIMPAAPAGEMPSYITGITRDLRVGPIIGHVGGLARVDFGDNNAAE